MLFVPDAISELVAAGAITCGVLCGGQTDEDVLMVGEEVKDDEGNEIEYVDQPMIKRYSEIIGALDNELRTVTDERDSLKRSNKAIEDDKQELDKQVEKLKEDVTRLENELDKASKTVSNVSKTKSERKMDDKPTKEVAKEAAPKQSSTSRGSTFEITYYTAFCDTGCTGVTADGTDVSNTTTKNGRGIVATDPSVIPLGTIVRIDGVEYVSADTGGDIKGKRIDILVGDKSTARSNGRHSAQVEILH